MGLRQLFLQLKALFQNLSPSKRATLLILIIGTVAGFSLLITWTGRADFSPCIPIWRLKMPVLF